MTPGEVLERPRCRGGLAPKVSLSVPPAVGASGGDRCGLLLASGGVGGDQRVPGGAAGGHRVQVPQIAAEITVCAWVGN